MNAPKRFLRLPAVMNAVGLAGATLYKRIKAGTFAGPVQLGLRAVAWDENAIAEWQPSLAIGTKTELA